MYIRVYIHIHCTGSQVDILSDTNSEIDRNFVSNATPTTISVTGS